MPRKNIYLSEMDLPHWDAAVRLLTAKNITTSAWIIKMIRRLAARENKIVKSS